MAVRRQEVVLHPGHRQEPGVSRGPATQQPHNYKQVAPFLGILRLPTCEVGAGGPTSEALVDFFFFFF